METLKFDLQQTSELNRIWNFGVNTCHAKLWERSDFVSHLAKEHRDLGFQYIRCHGILNDDMGVVRADGSFDFDGVFKMVDAVLKAGYMPFMELSSMPSRLASGENSICFYKFRTDPPKEWSRWFDLIHELMLALTRRYGCDNVKKWYFEVWNEPDISFWNGTQEEYFKLYDLSRKAIKAVCREYRVGGPATSKTAWLPDFCSHVSRPSADDPEEGIRCDFVSSHAYPSDAAFLNGANGDVLLEEASVMRTLFAKARKVIDAVLSPEIPLICGEWNSSAGPLAFNHDECGNGPFVCKVMTELSEICAGSMYWNATDIYEECNFHYQPFHGGYGLINVNGLYKAAGHAFRFLNQLAGRKVYSEFEHRSEEFGAVAALDGKTLHALVWNYRRPNAETRNLSFQISGLPEIIDCQIEKVLPCKGSAYERWRELGAPDFIDLEILKELAAAAEVIPEKNPEFPVSLPSGAMAMLTFNLK